MTQNPPLGSVEWTSSEKTFVDFKPILEQLDLWKEIFQIHKDLDIYNERRSLEQALKRTKKDSRDYENIMRLLDAL